MKNPMLNEYTLTEHIHLHMHTSVCHFIIYNPSEGSGLSELFVWAVIAALQLPLCLCSFQKMNSG